MKGYVNYSATLDLQSLFFVTTKAEARESAFTSSVWISACTGTTAC